MTTPEKPVFPRFDLAQSAGLAARGPARAPDAQELAAAALVLDFLQDVGPLVAQARAAYRAALTCIGYNNKWGLVYDPLGYRAGGVMPQHSKALADRAEAQNVLQVLVPAERRAQRLYQQLRFQPDHADLPGLEEHLLSFAYQTPRALLFEPVTSRSKAQRWQDRAPHRHTWQTLTKAQADIARGILSRHTALFPWGPKFAAAHPNA